MTDDAKPHCDACEVDGKRADRHTLEEHLEADLNAELEAEKEARLRAGVVEDVLAALADRGVRRPVRVTLPSASANDASAPEFYTTHKGGPHLPGKSRHWMVRNARTIPGAHKVGRDWIVPRAAYEAWLTALDARQCATATAPAHTTSSTNAHEIALRGLERAGYRPTKGGTHA